MSHSPAHIEQGQFLAEAVAIAEEREGGDAAAEQAAREGLLREQAAAKARIFADLRDTGLPMPVMLVWGGNDRAASLAHGLALFGQIRLRTPLARLHVINRAGAFPFREQPAAFVSALTAQVAPDIPQHTDTNNR